MSGGREPDTGGPGGRPAIRQFVWDWQTRLFHWLLVGLIVCSWWTAEERMMDWHRLSGVTLSGLLVFRLYWGIAGPRSARFSSFIKGPAAIIAYARSLISSRHRLAHGHNPLGALSVVAILAALIAQVCLGLFAVDVDGMESGPLARFVSFDAGRAAAEAHETVFQVLLILIWLHIAAIAFYLLVKRANLIGPMITGTRKTIPAAGAESDAVPMKPAPLWRMLPGLALAGLVVWLLL